MEVRIVNQSGHQLPAYETAFSAGMDLRAALAGTPCDETNGKGAGSHGYFPGTACRLRSPGAARSGLAIRHGITVLNTPGTIDADYRGEVKVIMINLSDKEFTIADGDRIAQMIISKHERVEWNQVGSLNETSRGAGGFGHTGSH